MPLRNCPTSNLHSIMLPQLILNLRQRQAIIMQMNSTNNILFSMAHSFKAVRLNKLSSAIVTEITLFYFYCPIPFTILNNVL